MFREQLNPGTKQDQKQNKTKNKTEPAKEKIIKVFEGSNCYRWLKKITNDTDVSVKMKKKYVSKDDKKKICVSKEVKIQKKKKCVRQRREKNKFKKEITFIRSINAI